METRRSTTTSSERGSTAARPASARGTRGTRRTTGWWLGLLAGLACCVPGTLRATPSSTVWTPMAPDIQSYGVGHWGVDNYFTAFRKSADGAGDFPTDAGFTLGILPGDKFRMEIGLDLVEPSDNPVYFNAKIGFTEGTLFGGAPALQLGIANVGTKSGVTDQNTVYLVIGKTIPRVGRVSVAPYRGNAKLLVDAEGDKANTGWMVAFDRGFHPVNGPGGEFNRFVFAADYASGKNALGGVGVGLYYFFSKDISLVAGPVWFNEEAINGEMKWTIQLDINHPWFGGK